MLARSLCCNGRVLFSTWFCFESTCYNKAALLLSVLWKIWCCVWQTMPWLWTDYIFQNSYFEIVCSAEVLHEHQWRTSNLHSLLEGVINVDDKKWHYSTLSASYSNAMKSSGEAVLSHLISPSTLWPVAAAGGMSEHLVGYDFVRVFHSCGCYCHVGPAQQEC